MPIASCQKVRTGWHLLRHWHKKVLHDDDRFTKGLQEIVDIPERKVGLLHKFLRQANGHLSKRARTGEFAALRETEVGRVEKLYADSFARISLIKSEEES